MELLKRMKQSPNASHLGANYLEQPEYTFAKDQEPINFNRKLYVRLFKRSRKTKQQFETEVLGVGNDNQVS